MRSSNHKFATRGISGGEAPKSSRVVLNPHRADAEELGPLETRQLKAGDVIRFERSGGGGYRRPNECAPDAVAEDVRNGYVSRAAVATIYGKPQD